MAYQSLVSGSKHEFLTLADVAKKVPFEHETQLKDSANRCEYKVADLKVIATKTKNSDRYSVKVYHLGKLVPVAEVVDYLKILGKDNLAIFFVPVEVVKLKKQSSMLLPQLAGKICYEDSIEYRNERLHENDATYLFLALAATFTKAFHSVGK